MHSLQLDFLSGGAAVDERLRPLSSALDSSRETLRHLQAHLSNAAQQNTQAHLLLGVLHTLTQQHQVTLRVRFCLYEDFGVLTFDLRLLLSSSHKRF